MILCICVHSYLGAYQLELDVLYVRTWLESYVSDSTVRSAVISHEGLAYMDAVVLLLKQQPPVLTGRKSKAPSKQQKPTKNHKEQRQFLIIIIIIITRSRAVAEIARDADVGALIRSL